MAGPGVKILKVKYGLRKAETVSVKVKKMVITCR